MPETSVIIPTYNRAEDLSKAIDSVLNQTYRGFEIIVIDDGSTDETGKILGKYQDKIRYFYQDYQGVSSARNKGIKEARGKYIALLDDDDEYTPTTLEECVKVMNQNEVDWIITDILRIENGKKEIKISKVPESDYLLNILKKDFMLITLFFKKDSIGDVGLYDTSLMLREDWDLNIRMIEAGKAFFYIHKPLYVYHRRHKSLMRKNTEQVLFYTAKVLKKHHKRLADGGNKEIARIYAQQMAVLAKKYFLELKDFKDSLYCLKESLKYDFTFKRVLKLFNRLIKK